MEVKEKGVCCVCLWLYLCLVDSVCWQLFFSSCRCQHLCTLPVQCIWLSTFRLHKVWGFHAFPCFCILMLGFWKVPLQITFCTFCLHQDFVTALSILLRGSVTEKLQWTFNLYDINRDGYINKEVCVFMDVCTPDLHYFSSRYPYFTSHLRVCISVLWHRRWQTLSERYMTWWGSSLTLSWKLMHPNSMWMPSFRW